MLRKYSIEGWPKLIEQELRDLVHFSKDVWHETCGVRERFKERLKAADHPRDEARARAKYFPSVDWGIESRKQVSRVKIWVSGARKQLSNLMDLVRKDSIQRKAELQKNLEALKNECQNQIADLDKKRLIAIAKVEKAHKKDLTKVLMEFDRKKSVLEESSNSLHESFYNQFISLKNSIEDQRTEILVKRVKWLPEAAEEAKKLIEELDAEAAAISEWAGPHHERWGPADDAIRPLKGRSYALQEAIEQKIAQDKRRAQQPDAIFPVRRLKIDVARTKEELQMYVEERGNMVRRGPREGQLAQIDEEISRLEGLLREANNEVN